MIFRSLLPKLRYVSDKSCGENKKTHIYVQKRFSNDYVENCRTAGQATDDNIIQRMRFLLDNQGYTHTHTHTLTQNTQYYTHTQNT